MLCGCCQLFLGVQSPAVCLPTGRPTALATTLPLTIVPQPIPRFTGVWKSDCIVAEWMPNTAYQYVVDLNTDLFDYAFTLYNAPNCDDPSMVFATFYQSGWWGISEPSTVVPGAFNYKLVTYHVMMYLFNEGTAQYLQSHMLNGTACPYVPLSAGNLIDVTNVTCPMLGLVSTADCPVVYDIMALKTNYITPQLYQGDRYTTEDILGSCTRSGRATRLAPVPMYNTVPEDVNSLVSAPVAVAVIVAFVLGGALFGTIFGLCCRRWALKRGAKLASSE